MNGCRGTIRREGLLKSGASHEKFTVIGGIINR